MEGHTVTAVDEAAGITLEQWTDFKRRLPDVRDSFSGFWDDAPSIKLTVWYLAWVCELQWRAEHPRPSRWERVARLALDPRFEWQRLLADLPNLVRSGPKTP